MESYIEVSALHNIFTIYVAVYVAQVVALAPISRKRMLVYASTVASVGCFLWIAYSVWLCFMLEIAMFFFFFRYAYKTYFTALILRYLCYATTFVLYGGSFHNTLYFVPIQSPMYLVWLVYVLVLVLLHVKWKYVLSKLSYVYEVRIFTKEETLHVRSYLDSGNLLTYQNTPILFIDKKYHAYFKNQRIELVVMNSVTASEVIRCYECDIQLPGCRKQQVYINADRNLRLPFTCCVLLNMNMMTTG